MRRKNKPAIFVGFNAEVCNGNRPLISALITSLHKRYSYQVFVSARALGSSHITNVTKVEKLESLQTQRPKCVFLTPSIHRKDTILEELLDDVTKLGFTSHGFIFPAGENRVVPEATLSMFALRNIERTLAVRSVETILEWVSQSG